MSWILKAAICVLGVFGVLWDLPQARAAGSQERPQLLLPVTGRGAPRRFNLAAEKLHFVPSRRRIRLEGKVILSAGELVLHAPALTVVLDQKGHPTTIHARGGIFFRLGQSEGQAGEVRLVTSGRARTLELLGRPSLRWAPMGLVLQGERILLDLTTGQLTVRAARARLQQEGAGSSQAPARSLRTTGDGDPGQGPVQR